MADGALGVLLCARVSLQRLNEGVAVILGCRRLVAVAVSAFSTATCWPSLASRPSSWWARGPSRASTTTSGLATNPAACVSISQQLHVTYMFICQRELLWPCLWVSPTLATSPRPWRCSRPPVSRVSLPTYPPHPFLLCSLVLLQLHGSVRDHSFSKLPRGVWKQPELRLVDHFWTREPHSPALLWFRPWTTIWLACG